MGTAEARKEETAFGSVFVVLNPKSGSCDRDATRQALASHFDVAGVACRVHETGHDDKLTDRVREAVGGGCDLVVAAGGDGTVSAVADALAGSDTPLGIIPLGTANVLARELGVPVGLNDALTLLAGPHAVKAIDVMELNGRSYLTQVGVGLDALMIRDTSTEHKRRFGKLAYLWTAATRFVGFSPRPFVLEVDGGTIRPRATQVLVANSGVLGQPPFRWGPGIRPDDGRLDVCVFRPRTVLDMAGLAFDVVLGRHRESPHVRYWKARREVTVAARGKPLPVQADGEIVGQTPVTVRVRPGALKVVVPAPADRPA